MSAHPTPAERAALLAICQPGASLTSAARQLGVTERALRARLERLYRRLGVNSAAQAAWVLWSRSGVTWDDEFARVVELPRPGSGRVTTQFPPERR